jgi:LAO/AO transport system kinase
MNLTKSLMSGDSRAAARLISNIENEVPTAREALKSIYCHTGRAHIFGVTGPPGTGKSTLVDKLVQSFRKQGKTVGVIAVDPSSPCTGGAVLGDRIRMQAHSTDEGVFIRSVATRGHLGGVARFTNDIVDVLDAMGKDIVIVETVGAGQDEVEIARTAHTTLVVLIPGMGDDIQLMKAGILEVGDIFVVNKADLKGADTTVRQLEDMLNRDTKLEHAWRPVVYKTQARHNVGIPELHEGIEKHRSFLSDGEYHYHPLKERVRQRFLSELQCLILKKVREKLEKSADLEEIIHSLMDKSENPYSRAEKVLQEILKC